MRMVSKEKEEPSTGPTDRPADNHLVCLFVLMMLMTLISEWIMRCLSVMWRVCVYVNS